MKEMLGLSCDGLRCQDIELRPTYPSFNFQWCTSERGQSSKSNGLLKGVHVRACVCVCANFQTKDLLSRVLVFMFASANFLFYSASSTFLSCLHISGCSVWYDVMWIDVTFDHLIAIWNHMVSVSEKLTRNCGNGKETEKTIKLSKFNHAKAENQNRDWLEERVNGDNRVRKQ